MSDSRVFLIRNFWKNEKPTTTENETETENPSYPKSETKTEVSETKSEQPVKIIEDQIKSLELSKNELKNENRKLEFKILRFQAEMAKLTTENEAAENDRTELAKVLLNYKARINQLESDNRRLEMEKLKYQIESKEKQAQLETYLKEKIKCKLLGWLNEF